MRSTQYGQSKSDLKKNYDRVRDIFTKSNGDIDKQRTLATTQANRIIDEDKAINRALVAKELGYDVIFDAFLKRAYDLGCVGAQEYREYQLERLGF